MAPHSPIKEFQAENEELRNQLAICTRKLATEKCDIIIKDDHPTSSIEAYLACRLVPLDKRPGVRPIGIGEVIRRVCGKAFMKVVQKDVEEVAGAIQVCA